MKVQHNIPGMNNLNIEKSLNSKLSKSLRRLSTGTRIATAADDAAGLAVSEKLRLAISEQTRCVVNTDEGVCVAQTADAALTEVSAMLHRAEQLCVQAKNDTLLDSDRAHLTDEINALYDEMERIFDNSEFNSLKLFNADGYNPIGDDSVLYEYTETVTNVAQGAPLQAWGALDVVSNKPFDLADEASGASLTMKLDSNVVLDDASSLNGKSFELKALNSYQYPIRITFSSDPTVSDGYSGTTASADGSYYYNYTVSTKNCTTVQDALDHLSDLTATDNILFSDRQLTLDKNNTLVDEKNRTVTFTFVKKTLDQTINGSTYQTENASGAHGNKNVLTSNETTALKQVDGADSGNNLTKYSKISTVTFPLLPKASGTLSDSEIATLKANSLELTDGPTIAFTTTGEAGKVDISSKDAQTIRNAIVDKINSYTNSKGEQIYSAAFDADGNVALQRLNCSETQYTFSYVSELLTGTTITASPIQVSCSTQAATGERGEQCTITLPEGLTTDKLPISLTIGDQIYTFCTVAPGESVSFNGSSYVWTVENGRNVYSAIADAVRNQYNYEVSTEINGSRIIATGKYAAKEMNMSVSKGTGSYELSNNILLDTGHVLTQTASIPVDLSLAMNSESAVSDLSGKGFTISADSNLFFFEFVCAPAVQKNPSTTAIDVTGCTSYDDVAAKLQTILNANYSATVTHEGSGKLTITIPTSYTSYKFIDGVEMLDGLFIEQTGTIRQQASGGTNATQPHTTINFSKYNDRNFSDLYGKGFRITCATCEGEFINIIFCHDAASSNFPSGKTKGVDANGNPITYTNYAVELKDMKNGSDIVRNIVDQLKGQLDHFTDVSVGTPSSVLQVLDKRAGNIELDGSVLRAEILSGVYTNCTYTVTATSHVNPDAYIGPPGSNTTAYYGYCPIYVGSNDGEGQYILVHLPNLSLELLNLDPPRPDLTDVSSIDDVHDRLVTAEEIILAARAQMGADQNRLEYAGKNLRNSVEQATASYSTIKDTDMATEMAERTKLSILQNFQQSTLAHIFENASSVLKLLY